MVGLSCLTLLTACGNSGKAPDPIEAQSFTEMLKPKLTAVVQDGAIGVSPSTPITATVADGVIGDVTLLTPDNEAVAGSVSPDGRTWTSSEPLGYDREYKLVAEAYGVGGKASSTYTFTTSVPDNLTKPYVTTGGGSEFGVGQPVAIQFDENIPNRRAAQDAIKITTEPPVEGAFYWVNNHEVRWRPEHFWAPGTKVTIDVNVYGQDLGDGLYGSEDVHDFFTVGEPVILTADDNTLQITVEKGGQVIRTMATSMGKSSTPTPNGTFIVGDQHRKIWMDSSTYGVPKDSPDGYRTEVEYATRMSYSGIFIHSAPWSVGAQGSYNQSHGCLNVSPSDALWVYNNIRRGDIVIVKNTVGGTLNATEGLGDWNMSWDQWKAGNAD